MYYNALGDHLHRRFGRKVYKLSLRGVTTCPNRDGTVGTRGCIFCSESGSGEFAARGSDIPAQLCDARRRVADKVPEGAGYIAYFQSFTNTYAPAEVLRPSSPPLWHRRTWWRCPLPPAPTVWGWRCWTCWKN